MCGICGVYQRSGEPPDSQQLIRMRDLMTDRGPDAGGLYVAPFIGLGTRRLRVLDLSAVGEQPMCNEDGTVWVAFNGEIYNFADLRAELIQKGHCFNSSGDTEVLVHGYEEWGDALPERLVGMFAFGIWDVRRQRLLLAGDKLGKKPLFYADTGDRVLFASDIKSVLAALPATPPMDAAGLDSFLMFGAVPPPHTIFKGIKRLRPGERATFDSESATVTRYWRLSFRDPLDITEPEAVKALEDALRTAVGRRLQSDVPLGALLSGGVDSSVVVALMTQVSTSQVETFTITSGGALAAGAEMAGEIARLNGARHEVLLMPQDHGLSDLPELVWQYGQPFGDPSALPTYAAAKLARSRVTVALTGDGGDEAFGGYAHHAWKNKIARWQSSTPSCLRSGLAAVGRRVLAGDPFSGLGACLVDQDLPLAERLVRSFGWIKRRQGLYSATVERQLAETHPNDYFRDWLTEGDGETDLALTLHTDYQCWLPGVILPKVDVATMAVGLEARCPLLDEDVVQLVAKMPDRLKINGKRPAKYLLRQLAARHLPQDVASQKKVGFLTRQGKALRGHPEFLRRLLSPEQCAIRDVLNPQTVAPVVEDFIATGRQSRQVWLLAWLELWMRMFLDRSINRHTPWRELVASV